MFSRFSTPTHCPVHPPLPENPYFPEVVPRCCLHRKRKQRNVSDWWSHLRRLGREETAAMMMCSSVPPYPVNEKHILFLVVGGGVKNLVIYEVWVKKNLRDSRGQIGHLKTPTLSGTSVMMDILIVVHTLSRRQEESNADVMSLLISEGGYSKNYHQKGPGLHHHFIRKSPLFLNSKH